MSPPVPNSCPSVHLTVFQAEEFVLSSCSQWSSARTRCLPASVPPFVLGGQSSGNGSSALSSGSASPSGSTLITGNTSQDSPLFLATNCTPPQMMPWYGSEREMQHLPGRPQHSSLQPLAFPPPTGHSMVIHGWHQPLWLVLRGCPGPEPLSHVRGWCGGMHLQSLRRQGQGLFFYIFLRSLKFSNCSVEMLFDSPPIAAKPPPPWPLPSYLSGIHSV